MCFLRAYLRILVVDLRLRLGGLGPFLAEAAHGDRQPATLEELEKAVKYAAWIRRASRRHAVSAQCLHRSLALHTWLHHDGVASQLRIGVKKENALLKAHAWVEVDGNVVNDDPADVAAFAPLVGLAAAGRAWNRSAQVARWAWD